MTSYVITKDCRINNKQYKKGQIVTDKEVSYYPTVMKPTTAKKETIKNKKVEIEKPLEEEKSETEEVSEETKKTRRHKK